MMKRYGIDWRHFTVKPPPCLCRNSRKSGVGVFDGLKSKRFFGLIERYLCPVGV